MWSDFFQNFSPWFLIITVALAAGIYYIVDNKLHLSKWLIKRSYLHPRYTEKRIENTIFVISLLLAAILFMVIYKFTNMDLLMGEELNLQGFIIHWGIPGCIVFILCLSIKDYKDYKDNFPDSSTWYCEKLQMHLCFDQQNAFIMKDGKKVHCIMDVRRDSKLIYLNSTELTEGCVFSGLFGSWKDETLVIIDRNTQNKYTFIRTDCHTG